MVYALLITPMIGAVIAPLLSKKYAGLRDAALRVFTLIPLILAGVLFVRVLQDKEWIGTLPGLCGLGLSFRVDGFRALYGLIAAFMWAITAQFSRQYMAHGENLGRYALFTLLTLTGVLGVFYADDLYTAFVFFEIMSIASYPWVAHEETKEALRAAATYLGVSIACGMVTLMGMFLCWQLTGDLSYAALRARNGDPALVCPAVLMLVGYCAKAGLAPLHIWLPKAHPVAPAPASALLSGMLTKTGLLGVMAIGFNLLDGNQAFGQALLALGLTTMLLGAVLAVFSVNLKRTLACSSLSQIGYIVTGLACAVLLGEEGALPAAGAVGHMVNHSLLKLLLFLLAGTVYMNAHTLELNALRGFGKGKPLLHALFLLGGAGLSGVPLFSGYASKTMIHESLVELAAPFSGFSAYRAGEWLFLFAAGLTTAYMLKLYICLFWQKNPDADTQKNYDAMNKRYLTRRSAGALALAALPLIPLGILPNQTLLALTGMCGAFLHREALGSFAYFTGGNLLGGGISLAIGVIVYGGFVRTALYRPNSGYTNRWPGWLDLEEAFYRPVFCRFLPWVGCGIASFLDKLPESRLISGVLPGICVALARIFDEMTDHFALLLRELFLVDRQELRRVREHNVFTHLASAVAEGLHRAAAFLLPKRWMKKKSPTDMRYGAYVTNAISFGLLLCAIGIVLTIVYVFIRAGSL